MRMRTDRLGVLIDQLDSARRSAMDRFAGLTDEEYLWEPVPGAWAVRPRGAERGTAADLAFGPGEYQLDSSLDPGDPPPLTTISWRLGHVTNGLAGRWEWTFGGRSTSPDELTDFSPHADRALELWNAALDQWRAGLLSATPEQLDEVGFSQYPWGLDARLPFISIAWWVNQELIHHHAEIALLRDLWRAGVR
jgi:hypothetical protein